MELLLNEASAPTWAAGLHDQLLVGSIGVFQRMAERATLEEDRAYANLCLGALTAEKAKRPHLSS